jgi:hypothetical protein
MLSKTTLLELLDGKPSKKAISEIIVDSLQEGVKNFVETPQLQSNIPFIVGSSYFIRTVTIYLTGSVKAIVGKFLILEDACWIADTGRFSDAMEKGSFNEVEPYNDDVYVNIDTIVDAKPWGIVLPSSQK